MNLQKEADAIPKSPERKGRNQDKPKPNETVGKVLLPTPNSLVEGAENSSSDEKSTEDKEDNYGLMSGSSNKVGEKPKGFVCREGVEFDEINKTPVAQTYDECGDPANGVQRHGGA